MTGRISTISSVRWIGISQVSRLLIQFAGIAILARILPVSDFGLMTMAAAVTMFASLLIDIGIGAAVVQRKSLDNQLLSTVFWTNVFFGSAIGAAVVALSPLAAIAFSEPRLIVILISLAALFPITALGTLHLSLLEREVRFRSIAITEIIAALVGLATALLLANAGEGVYALVGQSLAPATMMTIGYWILSRWKPAFVWHKNSFKDVWRFGSNLLGFNIINYFARNSDNILIGAMQGPANLGFYNLAYRLMFLPTQTLTTAVNRVLFPVYSKKIRAGDGISDYFLKVVSLICLLTAPISFGLWAVREPFVDVLLGSQWTQSAEVLAWLAPIGLFQALLSTTGSALMALGRTDLMIKLSAVAAAILISTFALTVKSGIVALSAGYLLAFVPVFLLGFYLTLRELNLSPNHVISAMWRPMACALTMAMIVSVADHQFAHGLNETLRLIALVLLGFVTYLSLIAILSKESLSDLKMILAAKYRNQISSDAVPRNSPYSDI